MRTDYQLRGSPLERIRASMSQMTGVTLQIARWFLQHDPTDVTFTTTNVADEVRTTRATVVRFCQRLGYSGFPEFKEAWIDEAVAARGRLDAPTRTGLPQVAEHVYNLSSDAIRSIIQIVDAQVFERTVQAMCQASLTVWCGLPGDAALIAQSGDHKMTRAALRSKWVSDIQGLQSVAKMMAPGDVLIVISHSGHWKWVADEMQAFRKRGCQVAIVTNSPHSVMAKAADLVLVTPARQLHVHGKPMALRASQWMIVEMLVLETMTRVGTVPMQWETEAPTGSVL